MTITHPTIREQAAPAIVAQEAFSRRLYARKNFRGPRRWLLVAAMALVYVVRFRRPSAKLALRTLLGREGAPFGR